MHQSVQFLPSMLYLIAIDTPSEQICNTRAFENPETITVDVFFVGLFFV